MTAAAYPLTRQERAADQRLVFWSIVSAFVVFGSLQGWAAIVAGGIFDYPLDDVYIHLSMAEQIARGEYGVNAGEFASAASSPLYPLLLTPFPGTEIQRLLPLLWNIVGLGIAAWCWGEILATAGYGEGANRWAGYAAAILGPTAVNMHTAAFTGMEHALHVAASLAILLGLMRLAVENRLTAILFLGIFFAPALRLEGLALALMGAGSIFLLRGLKPAVPAFLLALLPVAVFAAVLASLGLDPLPSSVQAKLVSPDDAGIPLNERLVGTLLLNLKFPGGQLVAAGIVILVLLIAVSPRARNRGVRLAAISALAAAAAHMFFGQIGWMDRYEAYVLAILGAAILALARFGKGAWPAFVLLIAMCGGALWAYAWHWSEFRYNTRAIHLQPVQSARFARDFAGVNVAVNDLGAVSWNNENYVLDLWGLASPEARDLRILAPEQGWAEPLTEARDVPLAMIYESWLSEAVGADWVKLGELRMNFARGYLGDSYVSYYATSPEHADSLVAALRAWEETLPEDALFLYEEAFQ